MKKEKNAEKTKVRKPARTKDKVSQWTTNPLNEKVLDYHNYEMTKSESVLYFVAAFLVGGVVVFGGFVFFSVLYVVFVNLSFLQELVQCRL